MSWRLIVDGAADGAANMAIDTAILEAVAVGAAQPTVRLYRWQPACVSIGALQAVNRSLATPEGEPGRDWVRRPSGGRAVLHEDELTYAVIAPDDHPFVAGGIGLAYQAIAASLASGLTELGVPEVMIVPARGEGRQNGAACYDAATAFELTAGGRKLVGSAQVRRSGALLQHGSLPITLDRAALAARLALSAEGRAALITRLAHRATALAEVCGTVPAPDDVAAALVSGFESSGLEFSSGELSVAELAAAVKCEAVYRSEAWSRRR